MMPSIFWTIIIVHILGLMSPGPDFIVVVKNTLSANRRLALLTVLGISLGNLFHTTYCALGLGLILVKVPTLFYVIRILGGLYLLYLAIKIFFSKEMLPSISYANSKPLSAWRAVRTGFLTNALNPKAMLFILGIFIMITKVDNPWWSVFFVFEMTIVTFLWFAFLVYCFSHPLLKSKLIAIQAWLAKGLALFLCVFAIQLLVGA